MRAVGFGLCILVAALSLDRLDTPLAHRLIAGRAEPVEITTQHLDCRQGGVIAAALRNDGAGWYAIDDGDHTPSNVLSVTTDNNGITVRFHRVTTILTFSVAPDEAFVMAGIAGGANVGMDRATIILARAGLLGPHRVSPWAVDTKRYPLSNLWIYGLTDGSCDRPFTALR